MFDMFKALGKMKDIQSRLAEVKAGLDNVSLEVKDEKNNINITITAGKKIQSIVLDENYMADTPKATIEADMVNAVNNAVNTANEKSKAIIKEEMKDHIPDIPGLDLSKFGM